MSATEWPSLSAKHLHEAKLYATRNDLVTNLQIRPGGNIAEIGVAFGEFSDFLIDQLHPLHFTAVDFFALHDLPEMWGRKTSDLLHGKRHAEYYADRIGNERCNVHIVQALSYDGIASLNDGSQDLIYIDAGHVYEDVRRDCEAALGKVAPGGALVFNDYILVDHLLNVPYGVVQVVNELVDTTPWRIVGLGLERNMFCDVALRHMPA